MTETSNDTILRDGERAALAEAVQLLRRIIQAMVAEQSGDGRPMSRPNR